MQVVKLEPKCDEIGFWYILDMNSVNPLCGAFDFCALEGDICN